LSFTKQQTFTPQQFTEYKLGNKQNRASFLKRVQQDLKQREAKAQAKADAEAAKLQHRPQSARNRAQFFARLNEDIEKRNSLATVRNDAALKSLDACTFHPVITPFPRGSSAAASDTPFLSRMENDVDARKENEAQRRRMFRTKPKIRGAYRRGSRR
jgi:hypothetical protein